MPTKDFTLENGLAVTVYRRRGSRNLRLSVSPAGKIRVTIPAWAPYKTGRDFAQSRQDWIEAQQRPVARLTNGLAIGKSHHLQFMPAPEATKITTRVSGTTILVLYPAHENPNNPLVQAAAQAACIRALRRQAEHLLPQRLAQLAGQHGFTYRAVGIKRLKSRWGSCDQHSNIVLNLFLMQLPWELIDYVLLHELTHARVLRHGPDFWQAMAMVSPASKALRKELRSYQTLVRGNP